jgi:DNA replication protein DnaC
MMSEAVQACRELVARRRWCVFLIGGYGNGKTHLAGCCHRAFMEREPRGQTDDRPRPAFLVVPDWLGQLRSIYLEDNSRGEAILASIQEERSLVVLDDWGIGAQSPWTDEKVYRVVNYRYEEALPTVVTSNSRVEELDPRVFSRLRDGMVVCAAPDVRGRLNPRK